MIRDAGPTEARVRAALLRMFERSGYDEIQRSAAEVRSEVENDGEGRLGSRETVQRIGCQVAKGKAFGCFRSEHGTWRSELDDDIEYTYSRGTFTVRRRPSGTGIYDMVTGECLSAVPGHALTKAFEDTRALDVDAPRDQDEVRVGDRFEDSFRIGEVIAVDMHRAQVHWFAKRDQRTAWINQRRLVKQHRRVTHDGRRLDGSQGEPRVTQRHLDIPELPPGYRVGDSDEGWLVGSEDCWFDDDHYGEPQDSREDAVHLAWCHFRDYGDPQWIEFIDALGNASDVRKPARKRAR